MKMEKTENRKLLAITAHPDDDILFGGTLLKLRKKGWKLFEVILTGNDPERRKEAKVFAKLIGIEKIFWLKAEDGFLSKNKKILEKLITVIRNVNPDVIILLNPHDYHKDHRQTHSLGLEAIEMATRNSYFQYGKPISDTPLILVADGLNLLENPDLIIDISSEFAFKTQYAKKSYISQVNLDLLNFIKGVSMARGARIKTKHGEAFMIGKIYSRPIFSKKTIEVLKDFF